MNENVDLILTKNICNLLIISLKSSLSFLCVRITNSTWISQCMHLKEEEESRTVENFDLGEFSFDAACWWEP